MSNCTDIDSVQWTEPTNLVSLTCLAFINVLVIVGNCLVIAAVFCSHKLRSVTNFFIVSLAVADLLVGIAVLPFSSVWEVFKVSAAILLFYRKCFIFVLPTLWFFRSFLLGCTNKFIFCVYVWIMLWWINRVLTESSLAPFSRSSITFEISFRTLFPLLIFGSNDT